MSPDARPLDPDRPRHALLAGGGSGGHVFPALAVAAELARRGWRVSFAGNPAGMEARLVPERGVAFVPLAARPVVGRGVFARVGALATLAGSALAGRRRIRELAVDIVVGTGGYASAPAALGAALARRPLLLVEPNARAGAANRWLSRIAREAALADAATGRELACRSTVTGVPVREEFFAVAPLAPAAPRRLLLLGGSQGSRRLNTLLPLAVAHAGERLTGLEIVHQCGERWVEETERAWAEAAVAGVRVEVRPFLAGVAEAMAAASLILSRAGAITLAEICAAGRPSLLVPLELAGGHQRDNAARLAARGAAATLSDGEATPEAVAARLVALLSDGVRLAAMGGHARALARPAAAAAIADRVEALVGGAP